MFFIPMLDAFRSFNYFLIYSLSLFSMMKRRENEFNNYFTLHFKFSIPMIFFIHLCFSRVEEGRRELKKERIDSHIGWNEKQIILLIHDLQIWFRPQRTPSFENRRLQGGFGHHAASSPSDLALHDHGLVFGSKYVLIFMRIFLKFEPIFSTNLKFRLA